LTIVKKNSDEKGDHIHGPEGFRGYLKRKLVSKGVSDEKITFLLTCIVGQITIEMKKIIIR